MEQAAIQTPAVRTLQLEDGMTLGYRELGDGPPVLLLHGWPTSSFLWRNVMPAIARRNRVVALDLPGFGASDKPLDATYNFEFFGHALDGFLAALDIEQVALGVHDLGGPVGVYWTIKNHDRVTGLALLNTLLYPEFSPAVVEFVTACSTPELRDKLTSPAGLAEAMRLGTAEGSDLSDDVLAAVAEPFRSEDERRTLAAAGIGLQPEGFAEIATALPSLEMPVRIVYGEQDRVLPDVADTMARVKRDLPTAELTSLPACGHFLQEEAPDEVGELLASFFASS